MPPDYFATDLFRDIPTQLNLIGDWINEKFGAAIIAESCNICQSRGNQSTNPPPSGEGEGV
jgi:hypothetical protein